MFWKVLGLWGPVVFAQEVAESHADQHLPTQPVQGFATVSAVVLLIMMEILFKKEGTSH
jgi:hypothetical protein